MTAPLVTIIIATYNWSSVLPYSIGSALRQTLSDFELLVVGDGCTDDSEAVVTAIGDPRVRWINLPKNYGHQTGPNNEGLRQARGKYIAYLGHDDLWTPQHLSILIAALEAGADLAFSVVRIVTPHPDDEAPMLAGTYSERQWIPPSIVAHRREAIATVGGWRDYQTLEMDPEADLWLRMHNAGCRIAFVPRLTAVKLPASQRRDVYKTRPCHEQASWFERIGREDDFETTELTAMLIATERARAKAAGMSVLAFCRDALRAKYWQARSQFTASLTRRPHARYLTDNRRRFKGLDRHP